MDLQRYSKDTFKRTLSDLVKYEEYVTEVNETKQLRGGKLPARVYQIVIMEPDALSLDDIKQMKESAKGPQAPPPKSQLTEAAKAAEAAKENPRK